MELVFANLKPVVLIICDYQSDEPLPPNCKHSVYGWNCDLYCLIRHHVLQKGLWLPNLGSHYSNNPKTGSKNIRLGANITR